jgi:hypothetical protein
MQETEIDSVLLEGRGCYTSVRIAAGRPRFEDLHLRRLERGAAALGLGVFDPELARRALREHAARLPGGEGAVRLQLSRDGRGCLRLLAIPRGLGPDPPLWSAITAPQPHEPPPLPGTVERTRERRGFLGCQARRWLTAPRCRLRRLAGVLTLSVRKARLRRRAAVRPIASCATIQRNWLNQRPEAGATPPSGHA